MGCVTSQHNDEIHRDEYHSIEQVPGISMVVSRNNGTEANPINIANPSNDVLDIIFQDTMAPKEINTKAGNNSTLAFFCLSCVF